MKHMLRLCAADPERETGGILIGFYSRDFTTAHVVEATSPPRDSKSGPDWFHRGTEGLETMLRKRWDAEPRTHYIGEWHFPTANIPWPSAQDLKQMRAVAQDAKYNCTEPILVIVCPVGENQWVFRSYVFHSGALTEELHLVDHSELEKADSRGQNSAEPTGRKESPRC